ncbi:hypothetical protein [Streptomyces sp. JB150]|uniref:hypothetical protein n=1 Tax=Streptomyces sp. JB150 TaxID=2714844 RepID=UPI0019D20599|nr:hypothetical protein [Streptomyces sp. JB150]
MLDHSPASSSVPVSRRPVVFGFGAPGGVEDTAELLSTVQRADRDGLDHFSLSDHPYLGDRLDAYAALGFLGLGTGGLA